MSCEQPKWHLWRDGAQRRDDTGYMSAESQRGMRGLVGIFQANFDILGH